MSGLVDFYRSWRQESNPWKESYRGSNGTFERRFLYFSVGYAALYLAGYAIRRSYKAEQRARREKKDEEDKLDRSWKAIISARPTVLAGTFHSAATALLACFVLFVRATGFYDPSGEYDWDGNGGDVLTLWQQIGLPLSLSYFAADCFFYCLPRRDVVIFVHHAIMCFCHYPMNNDAGALLAGCGDREWVLWLSCMGYTSEVATALMNYRWYLLQTLEEDWAGFAVVNVSVALGWAGRVVMFAYLLLVEILPRASLYLARKQVLTFVVIIFGHAGIGMLSLYWMVIMCRGGLKSLLVFKKKEKRSKTSSGGGDLDTFGGPSGGSAPPSPKFTFGGDLDTDGDAGRSKSSNSIEEQLSPTSLLREARAYVDGSFFDGDEDNGGKKVDKDRKKDR